MGVGIKAKLYRNTGTYATPVWDEVPIVGDVTVDTSSTTAAASTRESLVERSLIVGYKIAISGKIRVVAGNTDYVAMQVAAISGATVDVLALNGSQATFGAAGIRSEMLITKWSEDQALGAIIMKDFELMPMMSDVASQVPKFAEVTGTVGAPVLTFTDFGTAVV